MADFEDRSTEWLLARLAAADARWGAAMNHPKYRDEECEEKPFTEYEKVRFWWADTWRKSFHEYEKSLYRRRDVREGMLEGLSVRVTPTAYEED